MVHGGVVVRVNLAIDLRRAAAAFQANEAASVAAALAVAIWEVKASSTWVDVEVRQAAIACLGRYRRRHSVRIFRKPRWEEARAALVARRSRSV